MKYNSWTVIDYAYSKGYDKYYNCVCECGKEKQVAIKNITQGKSKSCGCLRIGSVIGSYKHGMTKSKAYKSWTSMRKRCLNKNDPDYPNWGGRGIKICDSWLQSFQNFYDDMGDPPKGLTLDRIDVNGNYNKENCRWTNRKIQNRNRRDNIHITFNNVTKTLPEWAEVLGIGYHKLWLRLYRRNWSVEKAFKTP